MRKATQEELMLGLEPEKYTKKPWNPYDFIGQDRTVKAPTEVVAEPQAPDVWGKLQSASPSELVKIFMDAEKEANARQAKKESDQEIEDMYSGRSMLNPWDVEHTKDTTTNPLLFSEYEEALRANPESAKAIGSSYNDAVNSTLGDDEYGNTGWTPVSPDEQIRLFRGWLKQDLKK